MNIINTFGGVQGIIRLCETLRAVFLKKIKRRYKTALHVILQENPFGADAPESPWWECIYLSQVLSR